jgi:hypothetical protein
MRQLQALAQEGARLVSHGLGSSYDLARLSRHVATLNRIAMRDWLVFGKGPDD